MDAPFGRKFQFRLGKDIEKKLQEIQEFNPEMYRNKSHVARCAIIQLHRKEVLKCQHILKKREKSGLIRS